MVCEPGHYVRTVTPIPCMYKQPDPDLEPNEELEDDEAWLEQAETQAEIWADWESEEVQA